MKKLLATLSLLTLLLPTIAFAALTTSIQAAWHFNESSGNPADSAGSNTLTNNGTATYAAGKLSNAAHLDSTGPQYFSIADNASLSITSDMTICVWNKITTLPADGISIPFATKYLRAGDQRSYEFFLQNSGGVYSLGGIISGDGLNFDTKTTTWTPSTGTYYFNCFVWTASSKKFQFYVNGAQQGADQTGAQTSIFDSSAKFEVGQNDGDETARSWVNDFDELNVWSRALTAAEITQLYNSGTGCAYAYSACPAATSSFMPSHWIDF